MAITGSQKAYLYARSGIARSGATRSNYVQPNTTVDWIRRDSAGNIIATSTITDIILAGSLHVTQALNDEPDTCSFEMHPPEVPSDRVPGPGDEIRVSWTSDPSGGATIFYGFVVVQQVDWRLGNIAAPWVSIQCQDAMWRFDARFVTYRFPAQSVTQSIADLVKYFCNLDPVTPHPLDFQTSAVAAGMPSIPSFDVVNQRPSTVMRTLTAAVAGGFYVDGLTVHAWANSVAEPNQANPQPLTVDRPTLIAYRLTADATQLRRRVLVEGKRASTTVSYPTMITADAIASGVALSDASPFPEDCLARIGSQWMLMDNLGRVTAEGANPPQTQTNAAFDPALGTTALSLKQMPVLPPPYGWIRVGNQYARYGSYTGDPLTGVWQLYIVAAGKPYGRFTVPIPANETVEWVDGASNIAAGPVNWRIGAPGTDLTRAQPVNTEVVTLAMAQAPVSAWPELESLVQDGRYNYAGAQARADADLAAFSDVLYTVEWTTTDPAALPGRSQVVAMSSDTIDPPHALTITILNVELTFPLRTLPPRRACTGGVLKPSTFLDLVVTTSD